MNLNLNKLSGGWSILGLPTGPFSAVLLVWFCFLISLLLSPTFALEEDFLSTLPVLIFFFPVWVVKLTIQNVKKPMKSLGNFWICIITKYLKFSFTRVKKKTELTRILLIVKEEKRTLGNTKTGIIITSGLKKKFNVISKSLCSSDWPSPVSQLDKQILISSIYSCCSWGCSRIYQHAFVNQSVVPISLNTGGPRFVVPLQKKTLCLKHGNCIFGVL